MLVVIRCADETRYISLKNSDTKLGASVINFVWKRPIADWACEVQNCFVSGRNFLNNVAELDSYARVASWAGAWWPGCLFFDFAAAFPSVAHAWLFTVLEMMGLPKGFPKFMEALYSFCYTTSCPDAFIVITIILRGILQGCPLSGTAFVCGIDPFLRLVVARIDAQNKGKTRACATTSEWW